MFALQVAEPSLIPSTIHGPPKTPRSDLSAHGVAPTPQNKIKIRKSMSYSPKRITIIDL